MARDAKLLELRSAVAEGPIFAGRVRRACGFARRKPLGAFGALTVAVLLVMAAVPQLFAALAGGYEPNAHVIAERFAGPGADHWLGTDQFGRDQFVRLVYGARTSVIIGFLVVGVSATLATLLGVASGYFGGWFDMVGQRLVDIGLSLPGLIFIILVVTSLTQFPPEFLGLNPDQRVVIRIALSVGVLSSLGQSRVIRGAAMAVSRNQYVEAARVVGASDRRIIFRHVLPNVVGVVIVGASVQIGAAILTESSLAFLGYGVQPPAASWGRMLNDARETLSKHPHLAVFPGLAIFFAVYGFNMLGDALRDALDPRLRDR